MKRSICFINKLRLAAFPMDITEIGLCSSNQIFISYDILFSAYIETRLQISKITGMQKSTIVNWINKNRHISHSRTIKSGFILNVNVFDRLTCVMQNAFNIKTKLDDELMLYVFYSIFMYVMVSYLPVLLISFRFVFFSLPFYIAITDLYVCVCLPA